MTRVVMMHSSLFGNVIVYGVGLGPYLTRSSEKKPVKITKLENYTDNTGKTTEISAIAV